MFNNHDARTWEEKNGFIEALPSPVVDPRATRRAAVQQMTSPRRPKQRAVVAT